ncbi:MAG: sulfite exporter TauE/SafE family protein [Alphaproteobacteria bacterium]|nr:MAG: sulfite exporter TauE/SafE family protein [Alphaproteobacteria bacterium]
MPPADIAVIVLAGIALFAAFVNGAIGYGFSSLTVPIALVFYTNRILNPATVVIEVLLNLYVLFINRDGVPSVWKRVSPIVMGLLPGIAVGGLVLAWLQPSWVKFGTYTVILPLILIQAAGWRRPIRSTWLIGLPFGAALGILYSVTTISGPPLAILFNNQGLVKNEFRAGLALVRVAESSVTAIVYYQLGLFTAESESLLFVFIPSVVVGVPLGAYLIRRLDAETFRRICMSFDAWVVGFGLSRVLIDLNLMASPWAYSVMAATMMIDCYLLYIFFTVQKAASKQSQTPPVTSADSTEARDRVPSEGIEPTGDRFEDLNLLLGYLAAIATVAILLYSFSPAIRLVP